MTGVRLASSSLATSLAYWRDTLGLALLEHQAPHATLSSGDGQAALHLTDIGKASGVREMCFVCIQ